MVPPAEELKILMTSGQIHKQTPIALFVYNRPAHANAVLESLAKCARLQECSLHIFCDGSRRPDDDASVGETRAVARKWADALDGVLHERDANLGLSRSIVSGVSELCASHGRVIVIEDDLILGVSFLDYMLQALDRYEAATNVYQISGYMFPVTHPQKPDAFFAPLVTTWGWATWARAWQSFDWNAEDAAAAMQDAETRRQFDLDGAYPYSEMLAQRLRNENDSWGILFWWAVFKRHGLVLHPRESLVQVGGFDGTGTHAGNYLWSRTAPARLQTWSFELPDQVAIDDSAFARIKTFLKKEQYPASLAGRIWRRLERYAAGSHRSPVG